MQYTVVFEPQDEGGYHAMCPSLPGCHSEGDSLEDATKNIREAMTVYIESMIAAGDAPPVEDILITSREIPVTT